MGSLESDYIRREESDTHCETRHPKDPLQDIRDTLEILKDANQHEITVVKKGGESFRGSFTGIQNEVQTEALLIEDQDGKTVPIDLNLVQEIHGSYIPGGPSTNLLEPEEQEEFRENFRATVKN